MLRAGQFTIEMLLACREKQALHHHIIIGADDAKAVLGTGSDCGIQQMYGELTESAMNWGFRGRFEVCFL